MTGLALEGVIAGEDWDGVNACCIGLKGVAMGGVRGVVVADCIFWRELASLEIFNFGVKREG